MTQPQPQNQIVVQNNTYLPVIEARGFDAYAWKTLQETVFPNASPESILMAIDYCKARNLDVLKKPVHIVPIWDSKKNKNVDSIWQGICELRTTAMRTAQYAGIDEAIYGEELTQKIGTKTVTFPKYAQVTVYRMLNGERVPFQGDKVFWLESFSKIKDGSPNSMWEDRPFGQIAKCAEANALRKAFPEEIGNDYIMDEVGGRFEKPTEPQRKQIPNIYNPAPNEPEADVSMGEVLEPDEPIQVETPAPQANEPDPLVCIYCGCAIAQNVSEFSLDVFKLPLCMTHQKEYKKGEIEIITKG